jgi:hypothetical protein
MTAEEIELHASDSPDRRARLSATKQALLQKRIASAQAAAPQNRPRIPRCGRGGVIPASFSQERMWLIHQVHPGLIA